MFRRNRAVPTALACVLTAGLAGCLAGEPEELGARAQGALADQDPVIFVHGCPPPPLTAEEEAANWAEMVSFFRERGYPEEYLNVFVFSGPTCASNIDNAAELASFVSDVREATGARWVDLVTHSMGAVGGRLYLRQGGDREVRDFVSLAGPNHGSVFAANGDPWQLLFGYPAYEGLREMYPPYACEGESPADLQYFLNGCLTAGGRASYQDETPSEVGEGGTVRYLSVRNTLDEIVRPIESACLNQDFINDCSDDVNVQVTVPAGPLPAHVEVQSDPEVMQRVFDFITSR